jgi:hypothetical protein
MRLYSTLMPPSGESGPLGVWCSSAGGVCYCSASVARYVQVHAGGQRTTRGTGDWCSGSKTGEGLSGLMIGCCTSRHLVYQSLSH